MKTMKSNTTLLDLEEAILLTQSQDHEAISELHQQIGDKLIKETMKNPKRKKEQFTSKRNFLKIRVKIQLP